MHLSSSIFTNVSKNRSQETVLVIIKKKKNNEVRLKYWCLPKLGKQIIISKYRLHDPQLGGKKWNNAQVCK